MEIQLIQLYVLVCHIYDTRSKTCFQRLSNNSEPDFTDQELVTIYLFGHLQGLFEKKAIHRLIDRYWRHYFPQLPAYQTFSARLNLLEQTFQTIGGYLQEVLENNLVPEIDRIIDSVPVMLARGGHADTALCRPRCGEPRLLRQQKDLLSWRAAAHHRAMSKREDSTPISNLA